MRRSSLLVGRRGRRERGARAVARARPRAPGRGRSSCRRRSTRCPRSCCRSCRRASPGSRSRCRARSRGRSASPARLRSSCTTPGCTRTRSASASISSIAFMWREVSSTSPRPPAVCPARLVPPPRGTTGTPSRAAIAHRRRDVVRVARERDRERLDREHARVRREQMPRVGVGAHLARQLPLQRRRQLPRDHLQVSPLATVSNRLMYRSGRHFLQIPGPTNVPDRVLRAIDRPTIDHRGPDFAAARPRGPRRAAARLPDRAARSSSIPPPAPARGRPRSSTRCRPATRSIASETGPLRDALAGDGRRRSGSRSSGSRATGATAPTRSGSRTRSTTTCAP